MDWIKELSKEEIEEVLEGDLQIVYQFCGFEVLCLLWENLSGLNIYISTKPLRALQRLYIKKYYNGMNIKELAHKLKVSEKFVYSVINDGNHKGR
jgi:Mor family transcriptional regulator